MATGRQAFGGETVGMIREAILHDSVRPARELNPELPSKIERLISKCLQKDRKARYQTASEVHADLESLKEELVPAVSRVSRKLAGGLAAFLFIASIVYWIAERHSNSSGPSREPKVRQLTFNSGEKGYGPGSISPDGKYLAYSDATGAHIQLVETGENHLVEGLLVDRATWEVGMWFPDSTRFLVNSHPFGEDHEYWSSRGSSVWVVSVLSAPRKLRDNAYAYSVSPDGHLISFGTNKGRLGDREIWLMDANGEHPRKIFETGEDSTIGGLIWSPDGRSVLHQVHDDFGTAVVSRDLVGGAPNIVIPSSPSNNGTEYLWLPDGRLIYISPSPEPFGGGSCTFWQMRLDLKSGNSLEKPTCLVYWPATHISDLSVTADGKRLAFNKLTGHNTTYVADLDAKGTGIANPRHFTLTDSADLPVGWTQDSRALIIVSNRTGQFGIYRQALNEDAATTIVPPAARLRDVRISSDGNWILFTRDAQAGTQSPSSLTADALRIPVTGGSPELVAKVRSGSLLRCARAPSTLCVIAEPTEDHKEIVVSAFDPLKGIGAELTRFTPDSTVNAWLLDLSPDGTRIAAVGSPEGPIQIISLRGQAVQEIRLEAWRSKHTLDWAADGKGILVSNSIEEGAAILRVDLRGNAQVVWKNPGVNWTPALESPDGRHLAFQSAPMEGNVWMMEDF